MEKIKHLNEEAQRIYDETVKMIKKMGNHKDIDKALIAAYAVEMMTFEKACVEIINNGELYKAPSGYPMINPWYTIRKQSLKSAMDIAKLFGFTPIVRKSLGANKEIETPMFDLLTNREKLG
jgi:hypothetical protein